MIIYRVCAAALDQALEEYLSWAGDPVATLARAVAADPAFILGHTTIAALNSLGGARGDSPPVVDALRAAALHLPGATDREKGHYFAAEAWAAGEMADAAGWWEDALRRDPRDLLALRLAHDTHFFLGDSARLKSLPLSVLPSYPEGSREYGFVLGMAAFGLEENGDYAAAEAAGNEAVTLNPGDAWAVHAVAHVLEMQNRPAEGIAWLDRLAEHWMPAALLAIHNWWHKALFLIEQEGPEAALALYDRQIRPSGSVAILDLVDAAALLWRLELLGLDCGTRWQELSACWSAHAEDHVLAFNDLHIAMCLAGGRDSAGLARQEASIRRYLASHNGTNARVSASHGLPVIAALRAFRDGAYSETVAALRPIFADLAPLGGSNAQRDLVLQTLGLAAARAGEAGFARAVAAERRRLKAGAPRAWAGYPALQGAAPG